MVHSLRRSAFGIGVVGFCVLASIASVGSTTTWAELRGGDPDPDAQFALNSACNGVAGTQCPTEPSRPACQKFEATCTSGPDNFARCHAAPLPPQAACQPDPDCKDWIEQKCP